MLKLALNFPHYRQPTTYEFTPVMHHGIDGVTVVWVYSIIYCESVSNSLAPLNDSFEFSL